jgi:hypothetical protein
MFVRRSRSDKRARYEIVWMLSVGLLIASCGKSSQPHDPGSAGGDPSLALGGTSGGPAPGSAGSLSIGGLTVSGGAADTPTLDPSEACAQSSDVADALPSILELVVDTSGSMDWPPGWAPKSPDDSKPAGATKWEITRDALLAAVAALPGDVALGVNFYPNTEQTPDSCLLNLVSLPVGLLGDKTSDARSAWAAAVGNVVPEGATPTEGAYRFGTTLLSKSPLPGNKFILLITDGTPTCTLDCECTEDNLPVDSQPLLEQVAKNLTKGVRTFVIGSPGSEQTRDVLSQIATEGGTAKPGCSDDGPVYCHFDMTTEPDLAAGLERALAQIALSLRSCEYSIPAPPAGQKLDASLVNVLYTPAGGATETIGRDPSVSDCNEGWQYSADGKKIVLCGAACDRVSSTQSGQVEILFGCDTVIAKPK